MGNMKDTMHTDRWLPQELMRRAATGFERAEAWGRAAECWADLGDAARAAAHYQRGGDLARAAEALLDAGRHAEALKLFRRLERQCADRDRLGTVRALLGQAACHYLALRSGGDRNRFSRQEGRTAYRAAREHITRDGGAEAWLALARHGARRHRGDLLQEGYETALALLEQNGTDLRLLEAGRAYLTAVRSTGDQVLARNLEERTTAWELELTEETPPPTYEQLVARATHVRKRYQLKGHTSFITKVGFSPDGQRLASSSNDGTIRLWDPISGTLLQTLSGHGGSVESLSFAPGASSSEPDMQLLAYAPADKTVRIWHLGTGKILQKLTHPGVVWDVAFSPDRQIIATACIDNIVRLWRTRDWSELFALKQHRSINALAFSSDGCWLASGSDDCKVWIWDVQTGNLIHTLEGHFEWINDLAFSPDGHMLASASYDKTIRLWNVDTGTQISSIPFSEGVNAVAWSPDGSVLFGRGSDKVTDTAIHFIHAASNRSFLALPQLKAQNDRFWATCALAVSPNGRLLATYAEDSIDVIQLWDISALDVGPRSRPATPHFFQRG